MSLLTHILLTVYEMLKTHELIYAIKPQNIAIIEPFLMIDNTKTLYAKVICALLQVLGQNLAVAFPFHLSPVLAIEYVLLPWKVCMCRI